MRVGPPEIVVDRLRWLCVTWVLTVAGCSLYDLVLWGNLPLRDVMAFHLAIALLGCGTSLVAVGLLVRLPYLVPALVATAAAGFVVAYAGATITYGTGGESLNGLMFRAFGGAIVGIVAAISAWSVQRWANRAVHPKKPHPYAH